MQEEWLTVLDVARILGRSEDNVRYWCRKGHLPAVRVTNGMRLFRLADVLAFQATHPAPQVQAVAPAPQT